MPRPAIGPILQKPGVSPPSQTPSVRVRGQRDRENNAPKIDGDGATVSIILPTYERGDYVAGAIESVLAQSYPSFELFIIDGGSTDETRAEVESFDDPRIRFHRRQEPAGASAARNIGVRETDGEFVAFIDSDDRWPADKLRQQVAALRTGDATNAVAYSAVQKAEGEPRTRDGRSGNVETAVRRMAVPTYTSTLLVRRRALDRCGGFDENLPCFEDWDLCLRLAAECEFAYVPHSPVLKGTPADNISAEPDRLATAVQRLRRKHDLPEETVAHLLADVGRTYCEAGRFDTGRQYLKRSLEQDFWRPNTLAAFVLSTPASPTAFDRGMDRLYDVRRRFTS